MAVALRYFTEFGKHMRSNTVRRSVPLLCTSLLYFVIVVCVRCRRKESACSLSHLLMSFLLLYTNVILVLVVLYCCTSLYLLMYVCLWRQLRWAFACSGSLSCFSSFYTEPFFHSLRQLPVCLKKTNHYEKKRGREQRSTGRRNDKGGREGKRNEGGI